MIRPCTDADIPLMASIVNDAARAYSGVVPADCLHDPYMPESELRAEIAEGVRFSGWDDAGTLVGIMGIQKVKDVTLIRHAYVSPGRQRRGIGGRLLDELVERSAGRVLVGTWAAATWAIDFYRRHGFGLAATVEEKNRLLDTYWTIPSRQRDNSVVLELARPQAAIRASGAGT